MGLQHAMSTDAYAEWSSVLTRARLGVTPADLHGSVTGFLCAGWGGSARELLASLALDGAAGEAQAVRALDTLVAQATAQINAQLRARQPVAPLLPAAGVEAKANALVDWCRGFLGGLGLTGVVAEHAGAPGIEDVLHTFGQIAATPLACSEADAAALGDVLDCVRQGVAQLHDAFAPTGRS